jgi:phosphatidate cytidylyltransferase
VVLSKIGDIFGYYCGNMWGKTHPFPRLSPGKTTEGCVGSFVAGCVAGVLCQVYGLLPAGEAACLPGFWAGGLAGASVNLASQAGDLFESSWKRQTAVKDSGTWFGPSGGMLDLVDSLLVSAPVAALTWPLLFRWI